MNRNASSWKRKLIYWVVGLFVFYTVAGFFILPPIIRLVAVRELSSQLDRQVSIQKVKLNPYVPSIAIRGLLILDKDGQPFVSWDKVYVSFQPLSIFAKAWTFGKIQVVKPFARAQMNKDYTFNFSDILQKFSTNTSSAPSKPSKPIYVRVKELTITNASLSLADFTLRTPFKRIIGPVHLELENFRTEPDKNSQYAIAGTTDAGEYFSWRGYFCLTPLRSQGQFTVNHVTLNKYAPLYQDLVQFEILSGQVGVHAQYDFEWAPTNRVAIITNAAFALRQFRLAQPGSTNDLVDVVHLALTGESADLESRQAAIGHVGVSGARLFIVRETNASINVVQAARPESNAAASGGVLFLLRSVTNAVTMLLNSTNQWSATIHDVSATNCAVHLEDFANPRPATLNLDHITAAAKNISNIPNTNLTAALSLRWNQTGSINVNATASILPLAADVHLDLENLNLNTLDAYLESQVNMLIPNAEFGLDGDVHVRTPPGELPQINFQGDTWLDHLHVIDGIKGEDLLKWDDFRVSGIDANVNPLSASIRQVAFSNVFVRAIIETNGVINLLAAAHPASAQPEKSPVIAKGAPVPVTNSLASIALPSVSIASVVVTNSELDFTDRSVTPNVNMAIEQGGGTIDGISSEQLQHADVDLYALVDGIGPVKVTGHINPFSGTLTNKVNVSIKNMDLLPMSPYSGKFAGYRISRGNLNVDLAYDLVGRKLDSKNVITLDQFTFGEKVNSPDATKLPVRLAIAILKDRQGKIVLDVPIDGSLDDPKFRIGKVVTRVIVNILTKVATSPFSLLGAAFGGGGQELSYQDFTPGSADLSDASKHKLDVLEKALYERPGLQLAISGSIDPAADRAGLQQISFEKELRTRQWMSLSKSKRELTTPDTLVLTPPQRERLVEKLYDEALANGKITPAMLATNSNLAAIAAQIKAPPKNLKLALMLVQKRQSKPQAAPPASASQNKVILPSDPREALLTAIIPVSDSDLEELAINRAKSVRSYILAGGKVPAGRLFLAQNRAGGLRQDGSRVYLELN